MFLGSSGTGGSGRLAIGIGIGAAVGGHADVGCRHELLPTSSNVGDNRLGSACGGIVRIYPRCYQCGLGAAPIWSAKAGEVRRGQLREDCRKGPVQKGDELEGGSVVEKLKVSLGS